MLIRPDHTTIPGTLYTGTWTDKKIPVYTILNANALNQLVGYVRHINAGYGTVLYRGQCRLYPSIVPSIMHNMSLFDNDKASLKSIIDKIGEDPDLIRFFNLKGKTIIGWELYKELIIEAVLQHYGAKTFCVDFVDNHWAALWFGLFEWDETLNQYKKRNNNKRTDEDSLIQFNDYSVSSIILPPKPVALDERDLTPAQYNICRKIEKYKSYSLDDAKRMILTQTNNRRVEQWRNKCKSLEKRRALRRHLYLQDDQNSHMFLFLYVADTNAPTLYGVSFGERSMTIDLRKAIPSTFLRPCAQHGWIVRGNSEEYDYTNDIACVLRINIPLVNEMLGDGILQSVENFFPSSQDDQGYHVLLARQIDSSLGKASKHKKVIPRNTLPEFGCIK